MKLYSSSEELSSVILKRFLSSTKKRFLVLIGGCSRSGKTTLVQKMKNEINSQQINTLIVSLDNWLLGKNERKGHETVRERFKYSDIVEAITQIMNGDKVYPPIYDPKTRLILKKRSSDSLQIKDGICIIDGVVALDIEELRVIADLRIFVDVDDEIRKKRLLEFYMVDKKLSLEEANKIIQPRELEEVPIITKTKEFADEIFIWQN